MKKFLATVLCSALLLSGCSYFSSNELSYNNRIAQRVNESSKTIEESARAYAEDVPNVVRIDSVIDTKDMVEKQRAAQRNLKRLNTALTLKSDNKVQEEVVQNGLQSYIAAGKTYLDTYGEILKFYTDKTYQTELELVLKFDEALGQHFTQFVEANNSMVDLLGEFVSESNDEQGLESSE